MSRRAYQAAIAMVMAATFGCGSGVKYEAPPPKAHVSTQIKLGMTEAEVTAIMGEPLKKSSISYPNDPIKEANKQVIWRYDSPATGKVDVEFKAGRVHGKLKK